MKANVATMSVSLPKELKEYVKKRTEQAHYGTPSDYIRGLIRDDLKRYEQERLEQFLLEGLASGKGEPMTALDWKELRNQVQKRKPRRK